MVMAEQIRALFHYKCYEGGFMHYTVYSAAKLGNETWVSTYSKPNNQFFFNQCCYSAHFALACF